MAHGKDTNPDTDSLGLDVTALVGLRIDEIRSRLAASSDLALIVGHEPVPTGWPEEIVKPDDEADALVWSYRTADGVWEEIYVYGNARSAPGDSIPAHIYTRRPIDASEVSIRPIVQLAFGADGTCETASAFIAEDRMILAVKEARRVRQPRLTEPKRLRPLPTTGARSPIEDLERLMELPRPRFCVDAEDFITESDGRLVLGVAASPQPLFIVFDAGKNPRLVAFAEPGRASKLTIVTDAGEWPPLEIGAGGLRVLPRCGMESDEAFLDFYTGEMGHRVIDPAGATRPVHILMVAGPCLSPKFPDARVTARVIILASPDAGPQASMPLGRRHLVVRPDGQLAQVHDPEGKVVVAISTVIRAEGGAYLVDGVVRRGS